MSNAQSLARTNNIAHALGLTITLAQPGSTYRQHILAMKLLAVKARYHAPFYVSSSEILSAYLDAVTNAFGSLAAGSLEAQVMESHPELHALYVDHLECKARYQGFWYQDAFEAAEDDECEDEERIALYHELLDHNAEHNPNRYGEDEEPAVITLNNVPHYEDAYGGGLVPVGTTLEDMWAASYEYDPDAAMDAIEARAAHVDGDRCRNNVSLQLVTLNDENN